MIRICALISMIALTGCAARKPEVWLSASGKPAREIETSACTGEAAKAQLSSGVAGGIDQEVDRVRMAREVMIGCMAARGYSHAALN